MRRFLVAALLLLVPSLAWGQATYYQGKGCPGPTCMLPDASNATSAAFGNIMAALTSLPANDFNTVGNVPSPILSPETANSPTSTNFYFPFGLVLGRALTATSSTANTYTEMDTLNLTLSGTVGNHIGLKEETINVLGTGSLSSTAELNIYKGYVPVASGATVDHGEVFETQWSINGTANGALRGLFNLPVIGSGSTINGSIVGTDFNLTNNSGTANIATFANNCLGTNGTEIGNGFGYCLANFNAAFDVLNEGHYVTRPTSNSGAHANIPTLSGCGTGVTAPATGGTDTIGLVTQGSGATGCTITFGRPYTVNTPVALVLSPGGTAYTYIVSGSALTVTGGANGDTFAYFVMGTH